MSSISDINQKTFDAIKNVAKPLSSYQHYTKHFREQWSVMSEDDKDQYLLKAKAGNQRYSNEKQAIIDKSRAEIKKHNIFLTKSHRVPCIGLDNGFESYKVMGPMHTVELFTEEEKKKLEDKGVSPKYIGKYKSINGIKFNWRAAKKYDVCVYGGNINRGWFTVQENYEGYTGNYTRYRSTFGKVWYSPTEADPRPPSDPQSGKTFTELHKDYLSYKY